MIRLGKAYADNTEAEEMKKQRELQMDSKNRNNSQSFVAEVLVFSNLIKCLYWIVLDCNFSR